MSRKRNHEAISPFAESHVTVEAEFYQGSTVTSMDFHPWFSMALLVGTENGEFALWDVQDCKRLGIKPFKVWEPSRCKPDLKANLAHYFHPSVNKVLWTPGGVLFGVAYSQNVVQMYSCENILTGVVAFGDHLEFDAHDGNVMDIAFAKPVQHLCLITCGEDTTIKVWDANDGHKLYTFRGHESTVLSLCPRRIKGIELLFSTSIDGKSKLWLYDHIGERVDYDCGSEAYAMAYGGEGKTRLFSFGTNGDHLPYVIEWHDEGKLVEHQGKIEMKRKYEAPKDILGNMDVKVNQFTVCERLLAVGWDHKVLLWKIGRYELSQITNGGGDLPDSPCIQFNRTGDRLAVATREASVKIFVIS